VASTAARNRGHERPGPAARQQCPVASGLRAGAGGNAGTEAGAGPTTPRRSAARRASRLRGRAHAPQAWRRALPARPKFKAGTPPGAPPSPSLGAGRDERCELKAKEPGGSNAPGGKKTALFDIVKNEHRGMGFASRNHPKGSTLLDGKRTRDCPEGALRRAVSREAARIFPVIYRSPALARIRGTRKASRRRGASNRRLPRQAACCHLRREIGT
jgi:hypothetical protein